ncbi:MAG TPA: PAS domain-containing protein, partial [Cytophagaceae bacterium]|nr:PAS domain-containing protein [Cytophagaceae bacterium]
MNFRKKMLAYVNGQRRDIHSLFKRHFFGKTSEDTADKISEQRLITIVNKTPVLIWISGTDKLCHFFNQGWLDFTGRAIEQEVGSGWIESLHPDDRNRCLDVYHTSFDARKDFYIEYRLKRFDGEYRWISDKGVPNYSATGEFEGYSGACMDIHDRIEFEEKLKESEARLRIAALSSELGTWDYNPLTQEMSWDSACKELFGSAPDTPVTLDLFWSRMHPDDQPMALESMLRALNPDTAENYESEYRIVGLPNDKLRWIRAKGRAFFDQKGNPVNFAGTVLDITEEKIALESLQKSERTFRMLADAVPQLIWTGEANGNLNYFSQAFFDFSGMQPDEVMQKGWMVLVHPDEMEESKSKWMEAIATGDTFISEHRFRRYDGAYRWQLSRAVAQRDEQNNILMWVGTS